MKLALQILLCVAGVFAFLLCPFGCQKNEGDVLLPLGAIPFPYRADDTHLYVVQPDPSYHQYETFARCTVRRDHAEQFLREYGFEKSGHTPGTWASDSIPAKIKSWWNMAKYPEVEKWTKRYPHSGYADAFLANDELFLYATGNYAAIGTKDRALARWRAQQ